ncbi:MAG: hypothetical protein JSS32_10310 [Verrucomicrobia bacterium]|nr:hypothetical protein [Verrucomicrobiota bacterium]
MKFLKGKVSEFSKSAKYKYAAETKKIEDLFNGLFQKIRGQKIDYNLHRLESSSFEDTLNKVKRDVPGGLVNKLFSSAEDESFVSEGNSSAPIDDVSTEEDDLTLEFTVGKVDRTSDPRIHSIEYGISKEKWERKQAGGEQNESPRKMQSEASTVAKEFDKELEKRGLTLKERQHVLECSHQGFFGSFQTEMTKLLHPWAMKNVPIYKGEGPRTPFTREPRGEKLDYAITIQTPGRSSISHLVDGENIRSSGKRNVQILAKNEYSGETEVIYEFEAEFSVDLKKGEMSIDCSDLKTSSRFLSNGSRFRSNMMRGLEIAPALNDEVLSDGSRLDLDPVSGLEQLPPISAEVVWGRYEDLP